MRKITIRKLAQRGSVPALRRLKSLNRGSTRRKVARTLSEQIALRYLLKNPLKEAKNLPLR